MNNRMCLLILAFISMGISIINAAEYSFDLGGPGTQTLHYGSVPVGVVQGDLDNDGVMDVVVGTTNSPAGYLGKCFILWEGTSEQELLEYNGDFWVVAIEDLDNNGYKDIICREIVFFNQGNREFIADPYKGFPLTAKFADLNGDGILDSVTGAYWKDGSDGTIHEFNLRCDYIAIIDMNDDGRLDVLGNRSDYSSSFWYENTGNSPLFTDAQVLNGLHSLVYAEYDYDYDGDNDLLVKYDGIMGMLINDNGLLPLNYEPLFDTVPDGFNDTCRIEDMDLDGDWDMFGYNGTTKRYFVVEQIGYRSLQFDFKWISDEKTLSYVSGYFLYQNAAKTYYYFKVMSYIGSGAKGGVYRTPINVQAENAVSYNWELFQ